jgi:hypothetical protein
VRARLFGVALENGLGSGLPWGYRWSGARGGLRLLADILPLGALWARSRQDRIRHPEGIPS